MILLAECAQGFGNPRFIGWFNHESAYSFERNLRLNYEINGQTAYATFLKAKRYQIVLLSSLTSEEVKRMSLIPASTLDEALDIAYSIVGTTPLTYLIPEGSSMLPSVNSP
jgi:nickel-dependent lactate racemase